MEKNYLAHWGILGMKWGKRRYQNKDGSLTAAGKQRYYSEADKAGYKQQKRDGGRYKTVGEGKKQRNEHYYADPDDWVKKDISATRRVADESSQLTGKLKGATDRSIANSKRKRGQMDLSNMTDKEMRDQINRAMLERQYTEMFGPQESTKGRERVSEFLDTAGTVLGVGASALGIALAIKELKG